jgi:hypothetical protein
MENLSAATSLKSDSLLNRLGGDTPIATIRPQPMVG